MKRYNKFYNVSLGNFLKVACCSLSIITIASCAEEPFEENDSSDVRSELLKAASDLRTALEKSGSDISIAYLDDIENLDTQKAQALCKNLEEIKTNKNIKDEVKSFAENLWSKCKSFFGLKKEENKLTDDKPSQAEPKLNKAEEWKLNMAKKWKEIENDVDNLITQLKNVGKDEDFCRPLNSILEFGKDLKDNDFNGDLQYLKFDLYNDEDKEALAKNSEVVLDLLSKIESEIDAFIKKFDKSEPAGVSPFQAEPKLTKEQRLEKLEKAIQNLIIRDKSFQSKGDNRGLSDMIIETGKALLHDGSANKLENFKTALNDLVSIKNNFENNEDVLDLIKEVESECAAFIKMFEPAGDSKVSK